MTKQEYEAAVIALQANYKCDSDYYQGLVDVDSDYIASLEADNAKLNRALDVAAAELERQSLDCPRNVYPEFDNNCCIGFPTRNEATCWREYALAEAGKGDSK